MPDTPDTPPGDGISRGPHPERQTKPPAHVPTFAHGAGGWNAPRLVVLIALLLVALTGGGAAIVGDQEPTPAATTTSPPATLESSASGSVGLRPARTSPSSSPWGNVVTPSSQPTVPLKEPPPQSLPPEQLTGYDWPMRGARLTSRFGPRGFGGFVLIDREEIHDGIDLARFCGTKVRAAHDGVVLYAGRKFDDYIGYRGSASDIYSRLERQGRLNELPITVVIDDGNGYRSMYVHLERADVEAGDVVAVGDVIGREGATGYATGCHLHYTLIRMDGAWQQVVPHLHQYGYPPLVRERVDPLLVLPWADADAPESLQRRAGYTPPASPSPSAPAATDPTASPTASSSPGGSEQPTGEPSAQPSVTP